MDTGFNRCSWCGSVVLTIEVLDSMEECVFAKGEGFIPEILPGRELKWVAVKGVASDWTIYCHFSDWSYEYVRLCGDKILSESVVRRLVPCTEEAWKRYRF